MRVDTKQITNKLTCALKSEMVTNFLRTFFGRIYVYPVSLMSSDDT
jgi:hypothetical protein